VGKLTLVPANLKPKIFVTEVQCLTLAKELPALIMLILLCQSYQPFCINTLSCPLLVEAEYNSSEVGKYNINSSATEIKKSKFRLNKE
jgi:hypothetical protein